MYIGERFQIVQSDRNFSKVKDVGLFTSKKRMCPRRCVNVKWISVWMCLNLLLFTWPLLPSSSLSDRHCLPSTPCSTALNSLCTPSSTLQMLPNIQDRYRRTSTHRLKVIFTNTSRKCAYKELYICHFLSLSLIHTWANTHELHTDTHTHTDFPIRAVPSIIE